MSLRISAFLTLLGAVPCGVAGIYQIEDDTVSPAGLGGRYFGALTFVLETKHTPLLEALAEVIA